MLFRLVRPVIRSGSIIPQFVQRIPADVKARAVGLTLAVPLGERVLPVTIKARAQSVRFSLRTRDPSEAKRRQAAAAGYLEGVWQALRDNRPISLSPKQAHALAGYLYRSWADEDRARPSPAAQEAQEARYMTRWSEHSGDRVDHWEAVAEYCAGLGQHDEAALEAALGPHVNRLLLSKGIARVDVDARRELLGAFWQALRDAFAVRARNAGGDYSPDPKAARFPEWQAPAAEPSPGRGGGAAKQTLSGLVEDWWREAKAIGLAVSTYESYRNTMGRFIGFLGHDDSGRVTADDVLRFKDHRLAEVNPRTGSRSPLRPSRPAT